MPVYNRAGLLAPTLRSILSQTFLQFELIVVDDGSTDDSLKEALSIDDPRVKTYRKENGERAAARNYGADRSEGRYLIFFDSDDLMYKGHLETVHRYLADHAFPEVAYTPFDFVDEWGNKLSTVYKNSSDLKSKLVHDNFLGCDSVVIRADIFRKFRFNEARSLATAEDKELWLRVSAEYPFHFIPTVGFAMVQHGGRSMVDRPVEKVDGVINTLVNSLQQDRAFSRSYGFMARYLYAYEFALLSSLWSSSGNKSKGRDYLAKAFFLAPNIIINRRFGAAVKNLLFK